MRKTLCLFICLVILISLVSPFALAAYSSGDTTVYITDTGECYHNYGCQYLKKSCIATTLQSAINNGYRACSRCDPPSLATDIYASESNSYSEIGTNINPSSKGTSSNANIGIAVTEQSIASSQKLEADRLKILYQHQVQQNVLLEENLDDANISRSYLIIFLSLVSIAFIISLSYGCIQKKKLSKTNDNLDMKLASYKIVDPYTGKQFITMNDFWQYAERYESEKHQHELENNTINYWRHGQ